MFHNTCRFPMSVLAVVGLLVFASQSFAEPTWPQPGETEAPGEVFYRLPAQAVKEPDTVVELILEIDGEPVASQTVTVPAIPSDHLGVHLSLFPDEPEILDRCRRAEEEDREVAILVKVDEQPYERMPWNHVVRTTAELLDESPAISAVAGASAIAEKALAGRDDRQACYLRCGQEFDRCDAYCEPWGGPRSCQGCFDQLDICRNFCSQCPIRGGLREGPWYETGRTESNFCALPSPNDDFGRIFVRRFTSCRRDVTRWVGHCDGTGERILVHHDYKTEKCDTRLSRLCTHHGGGVYFQNDWCKANECG